MAMKSKAILLIVIAFTLLASVLAYATPPYDDSAHGNTTYGVLWTTGAIYTQGHCGQCHTQHFSEMGAVPPYNFALFYDDWISKGDLFCYRCHSALADAKQPVTNYPYCVTFGGRAEFYANIRKQFCNDNSTAAVCGSKHHLGCVRNFIKNDAYGWGFNSDADPCVACHPPHAAQRNYPVAIDGEGKLNTAIRRPPDYKSTLSADLLWGDDANERMSSYAASVGGTYQSPYYGDTTSGRYEPSGTTLTSDGSDLPDYVTFCMDCHQYAQYDTERSANVKAIDWSQDIHGGTQANTCNSGGSYEGTTKAPYTDPNANYVLSCLDCHEPHGTHTRLHLIRRMINGQDVATDSTADGCDAVPDYAEICEQCHDWPHPTWGGCPVCHGSGNGFHGGIINFGMCNGQPGF